MISIIAAVGKNNELGVSNNLIWHIPEDMKFFKKMTMNKIIVMGYKTYMSLPSILPGRRHVVLTHHAIDNDKVKIFSEIDELIDYLKIQDEEVFIIGGASLYKLFINRVDKIYLTEIDDIYEDADVYFPEFDKNKYKKKILKKSRYKDINYSFVEYSKEKSNER